MSSFGEPLSASLGLVCGTTPQNPAQGSIEQALAGVMVMRKLYTLANILAAVPDGWSRAQAVSALTEGVLEGWIGSMQAHGRGYFQRIADPPPPPHDELAERFRAARVRARMQTIAEGIEQLLQDELPFSCDVRYALMNAHSNIAFSLKHVDF